MVGGAKAIEDWKKVLEVGDEATGLKWAGVSSLACSLDGERLTSGCGREVKVWDAQTGQEHRTIQHIGGVFSVAFSVAFSPDGKRLASASLDGTVRVWDAQTGQENLTLK